MNLTFESKGNGSQDQAIWSLHNNTYKHFNEDSEGSSDTTNGQEQWGEDGITT